MKQTKIETYLDQCKGKKINKVWKGYGSALFLELGRLKSEFSSSGKKYVLGQISIDIVWEWRIEKIRSIHVGSADTARRNLNQIPILKGKQIQEITLAGRLPELNLVLSNNLWISTCTHWQGQPEWGIRFNDEDLIMLVQRGNVNILPMT